MTNDEAGFGGRWRLPDRPFGRGWFGYDMDDQGSAMWDAQRREALLGDALKRCATGDREALREIFEGEGGRLLAMAERILRRRDLAEEALQDGMVRIWRSAGSQDAARGSAQGWINAVVRNAALSILRRDDRQPIGLDDQTIEALSDADVAQSADAAMAALESRSRLKACLEALEPKKRHLVLMAHLYGFTHGEIAGRLGAPLGSVKSWVRRGLKSLRECLQ